MTYFMALLWIFCVRTPLLYTAGMCDVTYIAVYTYLQGRCFLSASYNDIICLASPQSTLLFMFSDASSYVCATTWNSPPRTIQHWYWYCRIQRAPCFLVQRTRTTPPWFSFGRTMLRMFYVQLTELGRNWTWSAPWNATSCHIFLSLMDN